MPGNQVVLIHGFAKNSQDMLPLQNNLQLLGYQGILINLPLTFKPLEYSVGLLETVLDDKLSNLAGSEKIHLVGHSTGGLVIRGWLATTKYKDKVDKGVLLATPNQGSQLADMAGRCLPLLPALCKTLASLQSERVKQLPPPTELSVELGAIAGNNNNLLLGKLLKEENDGRVTVESVRIPGLKDFMTLPFGHQEIHKKLETAQLIDRFLQRGKFR
ncbi:alpha/beta fold hydrolase [Peptococcaceae bacterium 1198_IL3148]